MILHHFFSIFTPLLFNQSVSWPSQAFPWLFLLLWRHRDKRHQCYAGGLCSSQWFLCQFVTLSVVPIPPSTCFIHSHFFFMSLCSSLSLDLFGASMLQSCEKLALVQLVSSECRESMLELFANVHSMAHTPAWVTGFNYMGNCRENLSL